MEPCSITPLAQIEAAASMENWESLLDFVKNQSASCLLDEKQIYGVLLASEELLSNLIREANSHLHQPEGEVFVRVVSQRRDVDGERWFDILISDTGSPFDPGFEELRPPPMDMPIQERSIGGLGLFLVKSSVDQVSYEWDQGRNIYRLSSRIRVA